MCETAISLGVLIKHTFHHRILLLFVHDTELEHGHAFHHLNPVLPLLQTVHGLFEFSRTVATRQVPVKRLSSFLWIIATALLQMLLFDLVNQHANVFVVLELLGVACLHGFYCLLLTLERALARCRLARLLRALIHVVQLLFLNQHWVLEGEEFLGRLLEETRHLQRLVDVLVTIDLLTLRRRHPLYLLAGHQVLELEVISHLLLDGLRHEWSNHVLQLWQFRLNAPYCHECLILARVMQFFVGLFMIVINMWRVLVPLLEVALEPLVLLVLDRVFQLSHFLLHVVHMIVNLVNVIFQSLDLMLRGLREAFR